MAETTTKQSTRTDKPLTARDQRNLEKLIEADARQALNDLESVGAIYYETERRRIEATSADQTDGIRLVQERVAEIQSRFKAEWSALELELRTAGYAPTNSQTVYNTHTAQITLPMYWTVADTQKALKALQQEVASNKASASRAIEAARIEALRKVLMAGITGAVGIEILGQIPSAQSAFRAQIDA